MLKPVTLTFALIASVSGAARADDAGLGHPVSPVDVINALESGSVQPGQRRKGTGSFSAALVFVAANALVAVCCYLFVVGDIRRFVLSRE